MNSTLFGAAAERELLDLIYGVREESLTATEVARLEELILSSSAARRIYMKFVDMHAGLRWCASAPTGNLLPPKSPATSGAMSSQPVQQVAASPQVPAVPPPSKGDAPSLLGFLNSPLLSVSWLTSPKILALIVAGGLVTYFVVLAVSISISRMTWDANRMRGIGRPAPAAKSSPTAAHNGPQIGTLATEPRTRWSPTLPPPESVVQIDRTYELTSGLAEVTLVHGARVVIEGPAAWRIASAQRIVLDTGKLSAHVPKAAIGFTVATPNAEVIDLGTNFSVVANARETLLVVTQGEVQVVVLDKPAAAAKAAPILVHSGEAVSVSQGTSGAPVARSIPFTTVWNDDLARLNEPLTKSSAPVIVHHVTPPGAPGNLGFFGAVHGFDFEVTRPVRVTRLGVFDHLGDGIDAESKFTLQLYSRDDHATKYRGDDTAIAVLGEATTTAEAPGELLYGHRFAALAEPVTLVPGLYSVVAYGWSPQNPLLWLSKAPQVRCQTLTGRGAIFPLGWRGQKNAQPGTFPSEPQEDDYAGVTIEFEEL